MAGFVKGTGKAFVDGLEINRRNLKKIRTCLGSCLENPDDQLFMPTLFDDVAFGPLNMGLEPDQITARVTEALETVGLAQHGVARRQPEGQRTPEPCEQEVPPIGCPEVAWEEESNRP